jgi:hypothetical protein
MSTPSRAAVTTCPPRPWRPYGEGRVAVVGPHPEADASWYADHDLTNRAGVRLDLGHDLVEAAMADPR